VEFKDFFQLFDGLGRQNLVRVEVISLRLALHLLSLVHLGVTVTAAEGLELAQDVLKAGQRFVVLVRLWRDCQ